MLVELLNLSPKTIADSLLIRDNGRVQLKGVGGGECYNDVEVKPSTITILSSYPPPHPNERQWSKYLKETLC